MIDSCLFVGSCYDAASEVETLYREVGNLERKVRGVDENVEQLTSTQNVTDVITVVGFAIILLFVVGWVLLARQPLDNVPDNREYPDVCQFSVLDSFFYQPSTVTTASSELSSDDGILTKARTVADQIMAIFDGL